MRGRKPKTRFSQQDLLALKVETAELVDRLQALSKRLLEANLAHTGGDRYDKRVNNVALRLPSRLSALHDLLADEPMFLPLKSLSPVEELNR